MYLLWEEIKDIVCIKIVKKKKNDAMVLFDRIIITWVG